MTCELKAIVAVCDDWGIGRDGDMVVANRADMRHFVNKTKGHPVVMGRKTLESFPGGRPLKDVATLFSRVIPRLNARVSRLFIRLRKRSLPSRMRTLPGSSAGEQCTSSSCLTVLRLRLLTTM